MAKLLNLQEWAAEVYTTPPSLSTLRRWTREGRIFPAPELHGKEYKVQPDAIYVDPRKKNLRVKPKHTKLPSGGTLLERLTHGEKASTLRR
ncbi:TPA: excisionase [Citrobacter amalonaticus]|uniref:Excisionase n=1 Tax=Citrobacter amalonaticus TaxID=35703 RepID=A0A9C7QQ04_CITAM|nr:MULTISPECIES: excisionase [Citrobacter]MBU5646044.1 excisionase [Pluralibacter sp. S54_ASV_43]MEC3930140.1 excisionase [Citrobacter farmeri]MZK87985.1 excisionase [Citrobacter amalonaticus]MZK92514.1 excisionase [Citrobacter amalonaticus]MZL02288.1 excisionase [Citrobacter amalonaticus]